MYHIRNEEYKSFRSNLEYCGYNIGICSSYHNGSQNLMWIISNRKNLDVAELHILLLPEDFVDYILFIHLPVGRNLGNIVKIIYKRIE